MAYWGKKDTEGMESSHNARIADGPRRQARLSVVSFSMSETAASEWNLLTELHRMRGIHRRTRHAELAGVCSWLK